MPVFKSVQNYAYMMKIDLFPKKAKKYIFEIDKSTQF